VTKTEFLAILQQECEAFEAVEAYPHEPPLPGHFYLHPPVCGGDGAALRNLLVPLCDFILADGRHGG
jgi:hypothetical protein